MAGLTCGERAVRCLLGEEIDRVPFGAGIGWELWGPEITALWREQSGISDLVPEQYLGFERAFAYPKMEAGIYPLFEHHVLEETPDFVIYRDIRGVTKRDRRDKGSIPEFLDYPIKDADDWERFKGERLDPDRSGRISQDWDAFRARLKETGEAVQVGLYPWGVFGMPRDLFGVEEVLISFYTQPGLVKEIMDHLTTLWIAQWARVAEEVQIDMIHIWEDMSGKQGSLISPKMVKEFMMPCYDRIKEFGDAVGARLISVDTDGDCHELVEIMVQHGINYYFPFEVQAGNDIRAYRERYPTLGITGGLDKRALAGTLADVDREVERAAEMLRHGRYIPGFDHLIPPDAKWENFRYAAEQIRPLCAQARNP